MSRHVYERDQEIDLPIAEVFDFFSSASNLERLTPADLRFRFLDDPPDVLEVGTRIRYRLRINGVPVTWVTRITRWDAPNSFADVQEKGPYSSWEHTHSFTAIDAERTRMHDHIEYEVPLGPLGDLANRVFVAGQLRKIFNYREQAFAVVVRGGAAPETWFAPASGWTAPRAGAAAVAGLAGVALVARLLRRRGD